MPNDSISLNDALWPVLQFVNVFSDALRTLDQQGDVVVRTDHRAMHTITLAPWSGDDCKKYLAEFERGMTIAELRTQLGQLQNYLKDLLKLT